MVKSRNFFEVEIRLGNRKGRNRNEYRIILYFSSMPKKEDVEMSLSSHFSSIMKEKKWMLEQFEFRGSEDNKSYYKKMEKDSKDFIRKYGLPKIESWIHIGSVWIFKPEGRVGLSINTMYTNNGRKK